MVQIAISAHFYNKFFTNLAQGHVNLTTDTIKLALCTSSYTPTQATDQYWSTPQANEITGTGYTAGGATVGSIAITDSGWDFSGANVSWTGASFTARYAVLYDATPGSAASDILIGYIDFGANETVSSGTFSVDWSSSGIGQITLS